MSTRSHNYITTSKVEKAITLMASGLTIQEISKKMKVHRSTISKAVTRHLKATKPKQEPIIPKPIEWEPGY